MCQVVERHPDTVRERLWRTGVEAHSMLYCGGEVGVQEIGHFDAVSRIMTMILSMILGGNYSI